MSDQMQLYAWIDAYLDGKMTADEMASFDAMLRSDAAARGAFVDALRFHHALVESIEPVVAKVDPIVEPHRLFVGPWAAALAACVLLAAGLWFAFAPGETPAPRTGAALPPKVAMFTDAQDAVFAEGSAAPSLGEDLTAGPIRLTSGTAQVMFASTAVVDLTGPCEFEMTGPNRGRLRAGLMHAYVPAPAQGFAIDLPGGASVVDLGTAFYLEVDRDAASVRVTQGWVELTQSGARRVLEAGRVAELHGDKDAWTWIDVDQSDFARRTAAMDFITVESDPADGLLAMDPDGVINRNPDGSMANFDEAARPRYSRIGSAGNGEVRQDAIYFFELPTLADPSVLERAEIRLSFLAVNFTPNFNVDAYGLRGRDKAMADDADFFCGPRDDRNALFADDLIKPADETGIVSIHGPALSAYLRELYEQDGRPRVRFAAVRLNPDVEQPGKRWSGYVVGFYENRPDHKFTPGERYTDGYVRGFDRHRPQQPPQLRIPQQ
ncbi:MAG: hypothetical protein GC162_07690 [Planctomycetes bacterium]|nr:hypothetical protein [Planctomycetota bacterium]